MGRTVPPPAHYSARPHPHRVGGGVLPGQPHLASASIDGTVRLWRPQAPKALATLNVKQPVYAVALSPDGRTLASTGKAPPSVCGTWPRTARSPR
ncbi:WD40 repeat domain-containing protein [Streptomyces libani]|uniref:WD40 repeat domain-containing protein n=1 Tax=Streptomyces nigrescens TaxID=1920 RepID=UPI00381260A1